MNLDYNVSTFFRGKFPEPGPPARVFCNFFAFLKAKEAPFFFSAIKKISNFRDFLPSSSANLRPGQGEGGQSGASEPSPDFSKDFIYLSRYYLLTELGRGRVFVLLRYVERKFFRVFPGGRGGNSVISSLPNQMPSGLMEEFCRHLSDERASKTMLFWWMTIDEWEHGGGGPREASFGRRRRRRRNLQRAGH